MRIFLLGFMGSGKSTLGRKLASRLDFNFHDLDQAIETGEGQRITEIFSKSGEPYFRKLEREYLIHSFNLEYTVISLGGGTPCFYNNMELIKKSGLSIYLYLSPGLLCGRLKQKRNQRPLLKGMNDLELRDYVRKSLRKRSVWYKKSDIAVFEMNENVDSIYRRIMDQPGFKR